MLRLETGRSALQRVPGGPMGRSASSSWPRIVAAGLRTRVLILTTFDLDEHVYRALEAGASGFLLKDAGRERLVDAVRTVARGEALVAPPILERLVAHYVAAPPISAHRPEPLEELTGRETEVLRLVGLGRSNAEIAAELYVSAATVKTHIRHVLAKLRLRDRAQAVVLAHRTGLVHHRGSDPERRA